MILNAERGYSYDYIRSFSYFLVSVEGDVWCFSEILVWRIYFPGRPTIIFTELNQSFCFAHGNWKSSISLYYFTIYTRMETFVVVSTQSKTKQTEKLLSTFTPGIRMNQYQGWQQTIRRKKGFFHFALNHCSFIFQMQINIIVSNKFWLLFFVNFTLIFDS